MTDPGYSLNLRTPTLELPDFFASMSAMNKASLVMLLEERIISEDLATRIGRAVANIIDRENQPGARRSQDYLDFERELLAAAGAEASWLHVGRSRQDMLSTGVSLWLRAAHLAVFDDLLTMRSALLQLAQRYATAVIPTYTHGVQAQPTSFAHFALAWLSAFDRIATRVCESYARTNRSPLGAGAGTTSAFCLNRERLAALLGFDGVVENSFDANLVAPVDTALELCGTLSLLAVQVGQLLQDLYAPFYLSQSWVSIDPASKLTGISSMMPQKRNPRILEPLREHASVIIGAAQSMTLMAHNIISGMSDVRETVTTVVPLGRAHELLVLMTRTLEALGIDAERSLAEVNREYSAMTNLAEFLVQRANVPFREAHEFASHLTDFGRGHGRRPVDITYAEACAVYRASLGVDLPLAEADFAGALDPAAIVATRAGQGGPQPAEVERMVAAVRAAIDGHRTWLQVRRDAIANAS
ncbi:MAG TPA: lyase family protein, partial [Chloroflexota bacterium]|nr:lyase family protein [Chloroflexota bacterium]